MNNNNNNNILKTADSLGAAIPSVLYENPDLQKEDILNENKGKSGVYRWTNKETGKTYIGSSENLGDSHNTIVRIT